MEFKGSKGKWNLDENQVIVKKEIGDWVCALYHTDITTKEESKYNGLLISKAPEMLEMLVKITNSNPIHEGYHELKLQAIQLIKESTEM